MWQIWLIIAGVFLIFEMMTHGFLVFWFAIGAIFALLTSFVTDNIIIQTTVFIVSSTILIFATKPLVKKFLHIDDEKTKNTFSIIGNTGIVTEDIDSVHSTGLIKCGGEIWSAASLDMTNIKKDTEIEVVEIRGVKAIVTPTKVHSKV